MYTDEKGIVRCKEDFGNADIPFNARFPVLLPRQHHLTSLILSVPQESYAQWPEWNVGRGSLEILDCELKAGSTKRAPQMYHV